MTIVEQEDPGAGESPIKFGELPGRDAGRTSAFDATAVVLRSRPNEWALIETKRTRRMANTSSSIIRRGRIKSAQPAGTFEAVARGCDVWARYVGDPS